MILQIYNIRKRLSTWYMYKLIMLEIIWWWHQVCLDHTSLWVGYYKLQRTEVMGNINSQEMHCFNFLSTQSLINNFWKKCPFHRELGSKSNDRFPHILPFSLDLERHNFKFLRQIETFFKTSQSGLKLRNCANYKMRLSTPYNFFAT